MIAPQAYERDPRVDDYIDVLPDWQRQLCQQLRDLIHAVDPEVEETIKRTVRPYFVLEGNVCAFLAAKDHVNLCPCDGAIVPDPVGIITGGHEPKTARTISYYQGDQVNGACAEHDAQADHRQQPQRRMAKAQAPGRLTDMENGLERRDKPAWR